MEAEAVHLDPDVRIQVSKRELAALIWRLVPEGTFMGDRAAHVMHMTFPGGALEADMVADKIADSLIRIYDREL